MHELSMAEMVKSSSGLYTTRTFRAGPRGARGPGILTHLSLARLSIAGLGTFLTGALADRGLVNCPANLLC